MRAYIMAGALLFQLPAATLIRAQSAAPAAQPAAAADTAVAVTFGGWIDAYYAYDFNRPPAIDRSYTAEVARHNEFNINLAYVDATLSGTRVHGRAALQFGNSVQSNYAAEPRTGAISGPDVSRFLQEAWAGYKVAAPLWVDAGVFLSSFGNESFISRDNWTYTRSMVGQNSPTAEAGVRANWQVTPRVAAQVKLLNGWSIISETNHAKALGVRLDWTPKDGYDIAYDAFFGNEMPDSLPGQLRTWHEAIVQVKPTAALQLRGMFDFGTQARAGDNGSAAWRGWSVVARYQLVPTVAVAMRGEYYSDPEQVIVVTGLASGLRASGGSFDVDVAPIPRFRWRSEFHYLRGKDAVFPDRSSSGLNRNDPLIVTSLGLTW